MAAEEILMLGKYSEVKNGDDTSKYLGEEQSSKA